MGDSMTRKAPLETKQGNKIIYNDKKDDNKTNIHFKLLLITTWSVACYNLLSFNGNLPYFVCYNNTVLCISLLIFIILATFSDIIIKLEDISIFRPHPIFWRCITSISLLHITFFLILLIQPDVDSMRNLFQIFDSSLNVPLKKKSYAEDCYNYSYQAITDKFDAFVFGHFVGWMWMAITFRNREILWFSQILWEIIEIITAYFVPNFAECWWDQIVMDIFLCNGLGIEIGLFIGHKYFNMEPWKLCYLWSCDNVKYKILRFIGCKNNKRPVFKMVNLDENGYEIYDFKHKNGHIVSKNDNNLVKGGYFERYELILEFFWGIFGVLCQIELLMMNSFLLKLWLFIPTTHPLNHIRFVYIVTFAIPTSYQNYYGKIQYSRGIKVKSWSGKIHRFGKHCYLWLMMVAIEICVIYRAAPGIINMPSYNKYWLSATIALLVGFAFILCRAY